uniref:Uncharacterized protein n=1 Tax=Panagrolaimus superbus TaxID=310955 RepID=A0A914YSE1_9BILA
MAKRTAEAETTAAGIPDEPKEKAAKLDSINIEDEETPLLDVDVEAIKHGETEKAEEELNNKVEVEVLEEADENDAKENGGGEEPIIDEPEDDEGHQHQQQPQQHHNNNNNVQHLHEEGEVEEEEEEEITKNDEDNEKSSPPPIILPEDVVKDVEFKVPHLPPAKIPHDSATTVVSTKESAATSDATKDSEENGSTN